MDSFFSAFSPWLIWFILGIVMAFLELQMPGFVILFLGLGCWVVAAVLLIWPLTLTQQMWLFIVASIAAILLLRKWLMQVFQGRSSSQAETDYDDFPKGAHVEVVQSIIPPATGRIRFRGTLWDAAADENIKEGEMAEIIRYAGNSRQIYFVKKI